MCTTGTDIFLGLLAILFPPIAVWVKCGIFSIDSLINILLCVLGYIPGLLHAWYIIARFPDPAHSDYEVLPRDAEHARVTYVYVQGGPGPQGRQQRGPVKLSANTPLAGYGATTIAPTVRQEENGTWSGGNAGEGASTGEPAPPPYEQAVGDHKVQTRE